MTFTQTEIDFSVHVYENNPVSQQILDDNISHFKGQCKTVYEALMRGERLTTTSALLRYGIGDLRRRIKDLRDYGNVEIKERLLENRFKEWWIERNTDSRNIK